MIPATAEDFRTEFLDLVLAVKVVGSLDEAWLAAEAADGRTALRLLPVVSLPARKASGCHTRAQARQPYQARKAAPTAPTAPASVGVCGE